MSKPLKILFRSLLVLVAFLAVVECVSYLENLRDYREAESLLHDVQSMKLDVTSESEVQDLVQRYGGNVGDRFMVGNGCEQFAPNWKSYSIDVQNNVLNRLGQRDLSHTMSIRHFGSSVWRVDAHFGLQGGRLACLSYGVSSQPAHSDSLLLSAYYWLPNAI